MRGLTKIFGHLFLLITVFSCTSDDNEDELTQGPQLMVEAYVYANEHVDHVKVARIHDDGEADLIPINDAAIKISQGTVSANLKLKSEANGIYEIADSSLVFSGQEPLILEITYNAVVYTASTKFPAPVESLKITNEYINISDAVGVEIPLTTLTWSEPETALTYCIFSRTTQTDSTLTHQIQPSNDSPLYSLHNGNSVDLYADHFTHIGSYRLYVSAVNDEYIRMYTSDQGPELRGAPSNIQGAWGVFTAFNGLSVDIIVE